MADLESVPAVESAPAPSTEAPSSPAPAATTDQVWANLDAQLEKEAIAAASGEEVPDEPEPMPPVAGLPKEKVPEEGSRYPLKEEGIEEAPLPRKAREAFADIKDPRWRKIATDAYWYAEGYRKAGMHLSDIPKYREIAPTLETLQTIDSIAREAADLEKVFSSGTPESVVAIANHINKLNPRTYGALVDSIADNLPQISRAAYYRIGDRIAKNIEANLRRDSKAQNNEDLNTAADVISEWLGLKPSTPTGAQAGPQLPPEVQRQLDEANAIKQRDAQRQYEEAQGVYTGFINSTYETALAEGSTPIIEWVNAWGRSYNDAAKAELGSRIANRIMGMLQGSANVATTFDRLVKGGSGDQAHRDACARYLVNQAKALLPQVAPDELKKFQALFGVQAAKQRENKIAAATARRDVGSAGVPSAPGRPSISGRGKTTDQVFAEFEKSLA